MQSFTRSWRIIVRASYKCGFPSCTIATPHQYKCQHIKRSSDQYNDAQKVADATSAVANVDDYSGSARLLAATTLRCFFGSFVYLYKYSVVLKSFSLLRNVLGTKKLGDILSERESIANEMQDLLREATEAWGVTVERVEVVMMTMMSSTK